MVAVSLGAAALSFNTGNENETGRGRWPRPVSRSKRRQLPTADG